VEWRGMLARKGKGEAEAALALALLGAGYA
jgi:hypothetical protein